MVVKKPLACFAIGDLIDKKESEKWRRAGAIVGFDGKTINIQKRGSNKVKINFSDFIGKVKRGEYRIKEKTTTRKKRRKE